MALERREFLKYAGASVLALGGPLGFGRAAQAAREKELNILCWEGYNSAAVLDPFRRAEGAEVKAESLTNDPTMINRLRGGETLGCKTLDEVTALIQADSDEPFKRGGMNYRFS